MRRGGGSKEMVEVVEEEEEEKKLGRDTQDGCSSQMQGRLPWRNEQR